MSGVPQSISVIKLPAEVDPYDKETKSIAIHSGRKLLPTDFYLSTHNIELIPWKPTDTDTDP